MRKVDKKQLWDNSFNQQMLFGNIHRILIYTNVIMI